MAETAPPQDPKEFEDMLAKKAVELDQRQKGKYSNVSS